MLTLHSWCDSIRDTACLGRGICCVLCVLQGVVNWRGLWRGSAVVAPSRISRMLIIVSTLRASKSIRWKKFVYRLETHRNPDECRTKTRRWCERPKTKRILIPSGYTTHRNQNEPELARNLTYKLKFDKQKASGVNTIHFLKKKYSSSCALMNVCCIKVNIS